MAKKSEFYLVNCEYLGGRNANYNKAQKANELFEAITPEEADKALPKGCNGNVESSLKIDKKTLTCEFDSRPFFYDERFVSMYQTIPAALLMYRLACNFQGVIHTTGQKGYKVPWCMYLRHKETGDVVQFREWKGASGFGTKYMSADDLPSSFKKDLIFLLEYLFSNECAHPYDGLVAGGVA